MSSGNVPSSVQLGEAGAWDAALAAANPPLLLLFIERNLGHLLRGKLTPEDILQESLLEAWRSRRSFQGDAVAFRNWLLRIIEHRINGASDHHTALKRGGAATVISITAPFEPPHLSATPSRIAWYGEQADALRLALETLPEEYRVIVQERLVQRVPIPILAERHGLTIAATRSRFRKGSELLRSRLVAALGTRIPQTQTILSSSTAARVPDAPDMDEQEHPR